MTQGYDTGPRHAATLHGYDKFCSKNDGVSGWSPFFQRPYIKMTTQFGAVVTFFFGDPYWIRTSDLFPVKEAL